MGRIREQDRRVDVICQHCRDGKIIPIKLRVTDEDEQLQTYMIRGYKDLTQRGDYTLPSGVSMQGHINKFECRIVVYGMEKVIHLNYNSIDNIWRIV